MLATLRQKRLIWPAIATLTAFAILVALGTWQMQRKAWKEHLLAQIAERTHAAPLRFDSVLSNMSASFEEPYDPEYLHVTVSGRFHHDKEQFLWAPDPVAGPGYNVYTPLEFAPGRVVWVNRGYVPHERKAPETRTDGQVAGQVTVTGLVRRPALEKGMFVPNNEAYRQMYYWPAIDEMHGAAFGSGAVTKAPVFIDADAEPKPAGGWPRGGTTRLQLSNRHLEYALTWYGLAGALLAVFGAFAVARLRRDQQ